VRLLSVIRKSKNNKFGLANTPYLFYSASAYTLQYFYFLPNRIPLEKLNKLLRKPRNSSPVEDFEFADRRQNSSGKGSDK
jgi:hypothetical protein